MKIYIQLTNKEYKKRGVGYASAYLYFPGGESVHIFGWANQVRDRIKVYESFRYLKNLVYWKDGARDSFWSIHIKDNFALRFRTPKEMYDINQDFDFEKPFIPNKTRKFCLSYISYGIVSFEVIQLLELRQIPKKWIPEFDKAIEEYNKCKKEV